VAATLGYYAVGILTGVLGAIAIGLLLQVRFKSSEAS